VARARDPTLCLAHIADEQLARFVPDTILEKSFQSQAKMYALLLISSWCLLTGSGLLGRIWGLTIKALNRMHNLAERHRHNPAEQVTT
jgi:hypothetical protein